MISQEVLDGVYEVTTDLGPDLWQRCVRELQACPNLHPNHYHTEADLGAKDILVQGTACQQVVDCFAADSWLEQVVAVCVSDPAWSMNWAVPSVEWFRQHTSFNSEWHLSPARYVDHAWHIDCIRTVVHGLMFMTDHHDPYSTTLFRQGIHQVAITTGYDRGWMLLQNGRQEHRGLNDTESPRYVFKWMYTLKL